MYAMMINQTLLFMTMVSIPLTMSSCLPCDCHLTTSKQIANCSSLGLTGVPDNVPNTTNHLIMKNNSLGNIHNNTFTRFSNLIELDISSCNISKIDRNGFSQLLKLTILDVSHNRRLGFITLGLAIFGLQNTDLRVLKANRIVPEYAVCVCITSEMLKYFNQTKIEEIQINNDRIEIFEPGALKNLPSTVTNISAVNNRFTVGQYMLDIVHLSNLQELDISNDKNIPIFQMYIPDMEFVLTEEHCELRDEDFSEIYNHKFTNQLPFQLPPNLKILKLNYVHLTYHIKSLDFSNSSLEETYFNYNVFTSLNGPVMGLKHLRILELSHSFCFTIGYDFFYNISSLVQLNLSYNYLQSVLKNDTKSQLFKPLNNLTHLNLANNSLTHLPIQVFSGLKSCFILNLSFNFITSQKLNLNLSHMNNLTYLDLSANRIHYFETPFREQLDMAGNRSGNLTVNLSGNQLYCTCENQAFLTWLVKQEYIHFHEYENYECVYPNGTIETLHSSKRIFNELSNSCNSHVGLIVTSVASVCLVVSFVVGAAIYRFRWKLMYMYYAYGKSNTSSSGIVQDFEYDAFISYSEDSRHFVDHMMRSKLETESGLKLCLHNRDFLPSLPIAEGIVKAIKTSRKTVLVLSPEFVKSYWCLYEMNMADMETQHTGRDTVLILFYKHIQHSQLPSTVMYQIKTHTYIQYPEVHNDLGAIETFWTNLERAIACSN